MSYRLFISAGEPSGDRHAAALVRALRSQAPFLSLWGFGGPALESEDVHLINRFSERDALIGLEGVAPQLRRFQRRLRRIVSFVKQQTDLVILVDYPGFHLFLAQALRRHGIPVVYYILPQTWAWAAWRTQILRKTTVLRLSILPFEPAWFEHRGVSVTYVGHPLLDTLPTPEAKRSPRTPPIIGFFPGSRPREVEAHLPVFQKIRQRLSEVLTVECWLSQAPGLQIHALGPTKGFHIQTASPHQWFDQVDFAIAASGTVTLELALMGIPTVVVYRVPRLTAWLGRRWIRVPWLSLANLLAREPLLPEYIQDIPVDPIVDWIRSLSQAPEAYEDLRTRLLSLRDLLGPGGAADRAAALILQWLTTKRPYGP